MRSLEGKVIVITGAGRGLGQAYARLAAQHGATVLVNDVDGEAAMQVAETLRAAGGRAEADDSDIASWAGANRMIHSCLAAFGDIDGVCNNAGVFSMGSPLDQDPAELGRMVDVNLLGSAFVGMAAARAMVAKGHGGAIVNTVSGAQSGSERMFAYGATKGAVASLTYSWAIDLAPYGIRVNAISPLAHTRLAISISPDLHSDKPPEKIAPVAIFLLSDLSNDVNGQVLFTGGEEVALVSHPALLEPSLNRPAWTVESLAEAFRRDLAGLQPPVGRSRQRMTVLSASSDFNVH